jgi:hypothetical protein
MYGPGRNRTDIPYFWASPKKWDIFRSPLKSQDDSLDDVQWKFQAMYVWTVLIPDAARS